MHTWALRCGGAFGVHLSLWKNTNRPPSLRCQFWLLLNESQQSLTVCPAVDFELEGKLTLKLVCALCAEGACAVYGKCNAST